MENKRGFPWALFYFFYGYGTFIYMQELTAEPRELTGKQVKTLRKQGFLPVVLYGYKTSSIALSVRMGDFEKAWNEAGESSLILLKANGGEYNVLIHDVARDPIRGLPIHADFYAVRMDQKIRAHVPVEFVGESPAVKNDGGILIKVRQEVEVEALPKDLPKGLSADISLLASIDSKIHINEIIVPAGVTILADPNDTIALVEKARSEEELATLEQALEETTAEVQTEKEVKMAQEKEKETKEEGEETPPEKKKKEK